MKKVIKLTIPILLIIVVLVLALWDSIFFGIKFHNKFEKFSERDDLIEQIVLVNIGQGDREYLAELFTSISECNPKVVGADIFFTKPKDIKTDRKLAKAIGKSPTVIGIQPSKDGDYFIFPTSLFREYASNVALPALHNKIGLATTYSPYTTTNIKGVEYFEHFSIAVSQLYDSVRTKKFKDKVVKGKDYMINYQVTDKNFRLYQYQDLQFNCDDLKGRIVLLGFLGPGDEDKFQTPIGMLGEGLKYNKNGDMYGVVIIANQILMILEEQELTEW